MDSLLPFKGSKVLSKVVQRLLLIEKHSVIVWALLVIMVVAY
jgi:hypothetical protein